MTCKDCIHYPYDVCDGCRTFDKECPDFKDKSRFIELPCKAGDKVYVVGKAINGTWVIRDSYVKLVALDEQGTIMMIDTMWRSASDIGYWVFLTREEAEEALKARNEG